MLNVRLHDNTTRAGNAAELSLGSRASGQEYLCTPHEATVSAISLRSKKQFWGYKGPCLPMSSPLHKPDLLFHPKLSFKMSSSNDFSLPAAKCYHCLAWEPCKWACPMGIHRDISGGIWSSLHMSYNILGHARVCHLWWRWLCGHLPHCFLVPANTSSYLFCPSARKTILGKPTALKNNSIAFIVTTQLNKKKKT